MFSEKSIFSIYWNFLDIATNICSSYVYAYMGAFGPYSLNYVSEDVLIFFNFVFCFSIIKSCLTDFTPDGEIVAVTNISIISKRYINHGTFIMDIIC